MSISNFSNYIVISGKGIVICKAILVSPSTSMKSIEQLRPSTPRQTSALELLVFYCFRILLVYPCPLYYGMLILSCAHGACPTPPGTVLYGTEVKYCIYSLCWTYLTMSGLQFTSFLQCELDDGSMYELMT